MHANTRESDLSTASSTQAKKQGAAALAGALGKHAVWYRWVKIAGRDLWMHCPS